jgi:RND family efflux transporter MFP subunit
MRKSIYFLILTGIAFLGCSSTDTHNIEEEIPTVVVTQWTDNMEIFMEHETAIAGHEIKFIVHLTTLTDFQPVRDGNVTLHFNSKNGTDISVTEDELLREGIFTPLLKFQSTGEYDFSLQYQGTKTTESFAIGKFIVYPSLEKIPASEKNVGVEEITFLKEQQWKIDFATEKVKVREMKSAVGVVGEVRPRPSSYAEIVSPVEGIISIPAAKQLVKPGQKVRKGQTLAVLVPPLAVQNSWAEIYLSYEQAKSEFERATRLKAKNALSTREFEQAERNYEMHKAGISNYLDSDGGNMRFDSENQQFLITAPISGIVSDVTILPGQNVDRKQKLFSIFDPSHVWLRMELFSSQARDMSDISGVTIHIPGQNEAIHIEKNMIKLISRGEIIDPLKHTVTLWIEVNNTNRQLMIGQTFSARIYTSSAMEFLSVPTTAILDNNNLKTVYVHTSGETFEKREITAGPEYYGYTAVASGVQLGERIVTRGNYQVKLATNSEEIGHPHTH